MKQNDRGQATITYAILLPIFLVLFFGGYQLWKLITVKQGLSRAAYVATRWLAQQVPETNPATLQKQAWTLTSQSLVRNSFIARQFDGYGGLTGYLQVTVTLSPVSDLPNDGSQLFEVSAKLELPWLVSIPLIGDQHFTVSAVHTAGFTHPRFATDMKGRKPLDPETRGWYITPWKSPTLVP